MRTRFLNIDFFSRASEETLALRLPVPHLSPSPHGEEEEIATLDLDLDLSSGIGPFPFEKALSHFFSSVLPPTHDQSHVLSSLEGNSLFREVKEDETWRNASSEAISFGILERESKYSFSGRNEGRGKKFRSAIQEQEIVEENDFSWEKNDRRFRGLQLEIPAVDFPLVKMCDTSEEEEVIHLETPDFEIPVDIDKTGGTILYPLDISRSIYSLEDITVECYSVPSYYHEDKKSVKALPHYIKSLNFEVSEIGLDIDTCPSMEEEFHFLLSNIGPMCWVEKDSLVVDSKELLGSVNVEILECLPEHSPSKQFPEPSPTCLISLLDMDYDSFVSNMHLDRLLMIYLKTSGSDFFSLHFHEVEMLDLVNYQSFELFVSSLLNYETWEQMLKEETKTVGNFYEFILNVELALVDDTFKSLPVPFLCEDKETLSLSAVHDILDELKVQHATACDEIYLNWHILQEETCDHDICSTYRKFLEGMDTQKISTELKSSNVGFDSLFLDDIQEELNILQHKEILCETPSISVDNELTKNNTNQFLKDENTMSKDGEPTVINPERISLLLESMSQFNELKFFLKARKGITERTIKDASKEKTDNRGAVSIISSRDSIMMCSPEVTFQQLEIEVHHIKLCNMILDLIDSIYQNYCDILQNDTDLKKQHSSSQVVDDFTLQSLSKGMLMNLITSRSAQHSTLSGEDKTLIAYITLYASKQMAHYLCFFGIHSSHLYAGNLSRNLKHLRIKLDPLLSLIEDAYWKAEKGQAESHPSLSIVEEILRSNFPRNDNKVLIVSDRVFWWILNRKLTSMGVMSREVTNIRACSSQMGVLDSDDFKNTILNTLLQSDCLVISYEDIFPSFPFNKFSTILEYGGSYGSSRIATISPDLVGLPRIHFLKMELEEFSVPKALSEGFDTSRHLDYPMEIVSQSMFGLRDDLNIQRVVGFLNFVPIVEKNGCMASFRTIDIVKPFHLSNTASGIKVPMKSEDNLLYVPSFPDIVIVVNTLNMDKEVLISRRSSYQKILAMEKAGVQVIERELNLPVDLVFSADICLIWYDTSSFFINGTSAEKAFSQIPERMENIATNILMSLSFSFSGCIMVFEGDNSFLTAIMESSDGLYAAAVSLDVQLQLFCSYSSDLTDEIILNSIRSVTRLNQGLYPAMVELETLAESFLTRFPSINPISAHAILSSIGNLEEFLECPHDKRIESIGKYRVPDDSIVLFSCLCQYGQLGESKSGMTDCSSAPSSAVDSDNCSSKIQSKRKRHKYTVSSQSVDMLTEEHFSFDPLNRFGDCSPKQSKLPGPHQSRNFSTDYGHNFPLTDQVLHEKQDVDTLINDINWDDIKMNENVCENFSAEELEKSSLFLDNDCCLTNTKRWAAPWMVKEGAEKNLPTRRSSFGTSSHPVFPISSVIDSDLDVWLSLKGHRQRLDNAGGDPDIELSMEVLPMKHQENIEKNSVPTKRSSFGISSHPVFPISSEIDSDLDVWLSHRQRLDNTGGDLDIESSMEVLPMKHQENIKENKIQKSIRNTIGLSFQDRERPHGESSLSNPIHTSGLQQGPPWMIEFLNQVKEKSTMKQQSISCSTCGDHSVSSRKKIDKFVSRQSPSALDSYRYQGGSNAKKMAQQKWPKQFKKPLDSVKTKKAFSFSPTLTPDDKRARQNLSFARSGNGKQSKLVWSDGNVQFLRKRHRDEV